MQIGVACALAGLLLAAEAGPTSALAPAAALPSATASSTTGFVPPVSDEAVLAQVERAELTLRIAALRGPRTEGSPQGQ